MVAILSQSLLADSMWYAFRGHKFYTRFLSKFSKPPHIVKSHKSAAVALQDIFKTTFKHGRSRLHHGNLSNAWKQVCYFLYIHRTELLNLFTVWTKF